MRRTQLAPALWLIAASSLGACNDAHNICGPGLRPSIEGKRCVPMASDANAGGDEPDARTGRATEGDATPSSSVRDAGQDTGPSPAGDAGSDATGEPDAMARDAALDDASLSEDGAIDGSASPTDGSSGDAGPDAGELDASQTNLCPPADVQRWAALHLSTSLIGSIDACATDPACAGGACALSSCMRDAAGVEQCEDCVADEVACVFSECFEACRYDSSDAACLACACEAGCTTLFEQCSGLSLEVCDACAPAVLYCRGMHPWPALMVPIMHPLLGG